MTVSVERTVEFDVQPSAIWAFLVDPANRANAISVVADWERAGEATIWHIELPIPLLDPTVPVRTRDVEVVENRRVRFVGHSDVFDVRGVHELEPVNGGTRLHNRFVLEGSFPGVERFFEANLDGELENLLDALEHYLEANRT